MFHTRRLDPEPPRPFGITALLLIAGSLFFAACGSADTSGAIGDQQTTIVPASPIAAQTTIPAITSDDSATTTTTAVVPGPMTGFNRGSIIRQLAVTDDLVVAVGSACEGPGVSRGLCVGAIWTTTDTITWERVTHNVALLGEAKAFNVAFHLTDVAANHAGFVALASTGSTALFSPDGLTWERLPALEGSNLRHVVAAEPGFVAAGNGIWLSEDGRSWHSLDEPHPSATSHLAVGPDRIVAFAGSDVWSSKFGESWEVWDQAIGAEPSAPTSACLGGPRPTQVGRLVGTPDGFLVTQASRVWIEEANAVWTSNDAIEWNWIELPLAGGENAMITAVAVGQDLYVAFGIMWYLPDSVEGTCPDVVVTGSVAWMSSDAQKWTLIDSPDLDGTGRPMDAWFYKDQVLMTFGSRSRIVTWNPPAGQGQPRT
jgi:hypothetical protein